MTPRARSERPGDGASGPIDVQAAIHAAPSMPSGFARLMSAQFASALADNALLLLCIARCEALGLAAWWTPLLKLLFTLAYVLWAPWLGTLSDRWPKPWVMVLANGLKASACAGLLLGGHPVACFAMAGLGAAIYAPAKYGWITESVPPSLLVRANAWIEVCTVGAAIGGFGLGGWLVSSGWAESALVQTWALAMSTWGGPATALDLAFLILGLSYLGAGWTTRRLPRTALRSTESTARPALTPRQVTGGVAGAVRAFFADCRTLWRDADARTSLMVTTLFWGVGATVQLLVLAWARDRLGMSLSSAAYLQLCSAIGAVAGAWLAARWVPLSQVRRWVPLGVLIGAGIPVLNGIDHAAWAVLLMISLGTLSGLFIVPMNAWLQDRGQTLLSAGRSIAVQNFHENASILLMLGAYATAQAAGWATASIVTTLGVFIALSMALISGRPSRWGRQTSSGAAAAPAPCAGDHPPPDPKPAQSPAA